MPFYVPTEGADAWRKFLAEPDKQWRDGYSAKSLAECWEDARGIPTEVGALLEAIAPAPRLLFAFPEHKVALPGSSRGESQNDIFAFVRAGPSTVAVMVEGKVDESFDRQLTDWLRNASPGKIERLSYLASSLGLDAASIPGTIHYQLLHRTVSALIEADRYDPLVSIDNAASVHLNQNGQIDMLSANERLKEVTRFDAARLLHLRSIDEPQPDCHFKACSSSGVVDTG